MKEGLLALSLCLGALTMYAQSSPHVIFGEWPRYFQQEEKVVRVFLDKNGDYYPNSIIPAADLRESGASIREHFSTNADAFLAVLQSYGVASTGSFEDDYAALQGEIVDDLLRLVNALDQEHDLYILIHGFRKPMLPQRGGSPSSRGYASVRSSIQGQYSAQSEEAVFLEVYWDGTYDCCIGRKTKVNKRIFKLFEDVAQINASEVGYGLRRLVPAIDRDELTIVTHSLGAQVGLSLLTNTYDERIDAKEQELPTPAQARVNIGLIAPAISRDPFEDYDERTLSTVADNDNYHLNILYNEKDFVLKKRWKIFGPGPKKYGDTSLGCNCRNEAEKLAEDFAENFPSSAITLYKSAIGGTHRFTRYANSRAFTAFLAVVME